MRKKTSWKDKIDPAFDSVIKTLVKALDVLDMPSDAEIAELLKKTKQSGMKSFKSFYECDKKGPVYLFSTTSIAKVKEIGNGLKEIIKKVRVQIA